MTFTFITDSGALIYSYMYFYFITLMGVSSGGCTTISECHRVLGSTICLVGT